MTDPYSHAYGPVHRRIRKKLLPLAWGKPCPRCGQTMFPWQDLDLGHSSRELKRLGLPGDRIEHRECNRSNGEARPEPDRASKIPPPSREW